MSKGSRSFKFIFSMVRSLTHRNTISIVKTWFLTCIVLVICKLIISFYSILSIFLFTKIKIISADINSFIMVRNPTSLAEGVIFWFTSFGKLRQKTTKTYCFYKIHHTRQRVVISLVNQVLWNLCQKIICLF